jgi:hypothetical protein
MIDCKKYTLTPVVLMIVILGLGMARRCPNLLVPFATTFSLCLELNIVLLNSCSEIDVRITCVMFWRRKLTLEPVEQSYGVLSNRDMTMTHDILQRVWFLATLFSSTYTVRTNVAFEDRLEKVFSFPLWCSW